MLLIEKLSMRSKACDIKRREFHIYLTISRRRRGDYKPIFTEPRSGEVNIGL